MLKPPDESAPPPAAKPRPETLARMRRRLLAWYRRERRRLPWREQPSPYRTLVSEFMLQQTRVATVVPYFDRFVSRFESFEALDRASEQDVLAAWSGLGYYRRARALKRTAEAIVHRHGGQLPSDPEDLRALPGFGDYTTAAVGSIALQLPLAAVDGNVARLIARLFALAPDQQNRAVRELAGRLLARRKPGDWNQAMMELGATVCTPRAPRCPLCPLKADCRARALGRPEAYPAPRSRAPTRQIEEIAVAAFRRGRLLVLQRGEAGAFAGMWELPRLDSRELESSELSPGRVLSEIASLRARSFALLGRGRAVFTHHRISTTLYEARGLDKGALRRGRHIAHRWIAPSGLGRLAASKAQRRLFAIVEKNKGKRGAAQKESGANGRSR